MESAELLCNVTNTVTLVVASLTDAGVLSLLNLLMPVGTWHGDNDFGECGKLHKPASSRIPCD